MSQVVDPSRWSNRCGKRGSVPPLADDGSSLIFADRKVVGLVRNYMPHSTARVGNVTHIARDNVQMKMEDRLTGGGVLIEADVEAVRTESFRNHGLALIDCQPNCSLIGRVEA